MSIEMKPEFRQVDGHKLFAWQEEGLSLFATKVGKSKTETNFLACIAPNGGKTQFAAMAYKIASKQFGVKWLTVCVPSISIKKQWVKELRLFDIICSKELSNRQLSMNRPIDPLLHGMVVTYAQVKQFPSLYRKLAHRCKSMAILDEVHHLADEKSWGDATLKAFEYADIRLSLTGTPCRTDGEQIPFQEYEDVTN